MPSSGGTRQRASAPAHPSVAAEVLHFFGEVEVVFGLWAVVLVVAIAAAHGWSTARQYVNETVNYTEALFVVVIMALASTRPVIALAEKSLHAVARLGGATPAAWWVAILTIAPLMGSFITEPAAMTICRGAAGRKFYDLSPSPRLKYATLGLLFVNVSIGGTLTHFAAPPVLMVARHWDWDTAYMLDELRLARRRGDCRGHRGRTSSCSGASFRRCRACRRSPTSSSSKKDRRRRQGPVAGAGLGDTVHVLFIAWTVFTCSLSGAVSRRLSVLSRLRGRHRRVSEPRSSCAAPLLVGFFLGGLVIHGGLQAGGSRPCSRA